jgi:L-lactate dehydrogenase complex protein LldF
VEVLTWKMWQIINTHPLINTAGLKILSVLGVKLPKIGPLKHWTRYRTTPGLAKKSLHEMVKQHGVDHE